MLRRLATQKSDLLTFDAEQAVPYALLKQLCTALEPSEKAAMARLDTIVKGAKFHFPPEGQQQQANPNPTKAAREKLERKDYSRMVGPSKGASSSESMARQPVPAQPGSSLLNMLFSSLGGGVACFVGLASLTSCSTEMRVLWAVLAGLVVLVVEIILLQRANKF